MSDSNIADYTSGSSESSPSRTINVNASWSVINKVATYAISLLFTAILSRMIAPSEFGIFAMAMTVSAFFLIFSDGGMVWSLIQKKDIKAEEVSNLRWLNGGLGLLMWAGVALVAPLMANLYSQPDVATLLFVLGINFFLVGISTPATMWMKRNMAFRDIAMIEIMSNVCGGVIAVWSAWQGAGFWALAIQTLIKSFVNMSLVCLYAKCPLLRYDSTIDMRKMALFGSALVGYGIVNYMARNFDNVLLGVMTSTEELAFYSRAYFLMMLPSMITTGALTGLMVSLLSGLQDKRNEYHKQYIQCLRFIFIVTAPIAIYFCLFPLDPILLLYGEQWISVAPLLQILSIACLTQPLHNTMGWLFTSCGAGGKMLRWGVFASICLTLSFLIGIRWGVEGIAVSYTLVMGLSLTVGALWAAHKAANITVITTLRSLLKPLVVVVTTVTVVYLIERLAPLQLSSLFTTIVYHGMLIVTCYFSLLLIAYRGEVKRILRISP
ncbi:lipopolysaccharide biosynthesis protein [Aestuariibacter sp. AA17]|uniref:Lipopolysaccharide biosynthesis protein n=1 Tax=Fluctibacter corallii TaxID=2984329 RepID=A0ABT3ADG7_9ALTE|nr:lipopolysaccharide biosynthesis protein [Aestuariibacter sp. AA17]MCV2886693.1 lipopolysaccharide biosynthesis protein [Aestuariibacter sp. AA17]